MNTFDLRKFLVENKLTTNAKQQYKSILQEATDIISVKAGHVLLSDYAKKHIETHNQVGIGSVFAKGVNINAIKKAIQSAPVAGEGDAYTVKMPGVGYNLVLPIDKAKKLPGAEETTVKKQERGQDIEVPAIKTSAPLTSFKTDQLTLVIRPSNAQYLPDDVKNNKDVLAAIESKQSYSVLTAFPGDPTIPPASQWNGKYAVIIPAQSLEEDEEDSGYLNRKYKEGEAGASEEEIKNVIAFYKKNPKIWEMAGKKAFEEMAEGKGDPDVKDNRYPEWKKEDFQKVLDALENI